MEEILTKTVKEMVTEDYRTAAVFEKYSIDFCCGGKKSLEAACAERGVDLSPVVDELKNIGMPGNERTPRYSEWDLGTLASFIIENHHRYVREAVPVLLAHTQKIASVHGGRHPELLGIAERFQQVADELMHHMAKEEQVLFPYISMLAEASRKGATPPRPPFQTISNPIGMMEAEHQSAGDSLYDIRSASSGYTVPADGCTTYRVAYAELEAFEKDLHQHVHLENNILFPRAIALESTLFGRAR